MTEILVIAEHDGTSLSQGTARAVTCAKAIHSAAIDICVLDAKPVAVAEQAASLNGVRRVLTVARPANSPMLAATWAPQIAELARHYSHLLAPGSTFGKDLMPRVAALCGVAQLSDIMAVDGPYRFQRPIYAGNAIVTVEADPERLVAATVRSASFDATGSDGRAAIESRTIEIDLPAHTRFVGRESGRHEGPDLQTADRVVAGGRALGSIANFSLIDDLAAVLGAAVGASRAAVDAGYIANDRQVGQTGKVIAPDLYLAIGISGAIQHLTGIKDAGTIVAINKDGDAPIFGIADLGLVADLFMAVPELTQRLSDRR
ncbi:MAG: FAD-binding protein [Gammaproteobacteria bacterium]|jgi:electron transfer flavoprotein alpha subunit